MIKRMTHVTLMLPILWVIAPVTTALAQSELPYGAPISVEHAKQAAATAATQMRKLNLDMTIAIVDSGSNLVYLERSNQAGIGTIDAAIGKAKASLEAFCGQTIEERLMSDRVGGLAASI
jgi:hypothetical protein